jgi:hypothetical protein
MLLALDETGVRSSRDAKGIPPMVQVTPSHTPPRPAHCPLYLPTSAVASPSMRIPAAPSLAYPWSMATV